MVEAAGSKCSEEQLGREDFTVVTAAASNYKKGGRVLYRPNILKEDLKRMRLQLKRILSRFQWMIKNAKSETQIFLS